MSSCYPLGDGEKISVTITMPAYEKVAGVKPCHSDTTLVGYGATFTFSLLLYVKHQIEAFTNLQVSDIAKSRHG